MIPWIENLITCSKCLYVYKVSSLCKVKCRHNHRIKSVCDVLWSWLLWARLCMHGFINARAQEFRISLRIALLSQPLIRTRKTSSVSLAAVPCKTRLVSNALLPTIGWLRATSWLKTLRCLMSQAGRVIEAEVWTCRSCCTRSFACARWYFPRVGTRY